MLKKYTCKLTYHHKNVTVASVIVETDEFAGHTPKYQCHPHVHHVAIKVGGIPLHGNVHSSILPYRVDTCSTSSAVVLVVISVRTAMKRDLDFVTDVGALVTVSVVFVGGEVETID